MVVLAGIVACIAAWIMNRMFLNLLGPRVIMIAPLVEEAVKTGAALLFQASIILTHGVFGLIEGFYDAWGSGTKGIKAGIISFLGHVFYGTLTAQIWEKTNSLMLGFSVSFFTHFIWNVVVIRFIVIYKDKRKLH